MKTYEIKLEPVMVNGQLKNKYNIYYYNEQGILENKEFHSLDGVSGTIRSGYTKK